MKHTCVVHTTTHTHTAPAHTAHADTAHMHECTCRGCLFPGTMQRASALAVALPADQPACALRCRETRNIIAGPVAVPDDIELVEFTEAERQTALAAGPLDWRAKGTPARRAGALGTAAAASVTGVLPADSFTCACVCRRARAVVRG